jgi:hypothetical protein
MYSERRTAKKNGNKYYFTGKTCPNGHTVPRFTSNGGCTACLSKLELSVEQVDHTKTCIKCGTEFTGVQCGQCRWVLGKKWAAQNREYLAAHQRARVEQCRWYSRWVRENTPCADCGIEYKWFQMEYDHVDGRTGPTVSQLVGQGTLQKLTTEINKCDVVCANCHSTRTHFRAIATGQRKECNI